MSLLRAVDAHHMSCLFFLRTKPFLLVNNGPISMNRNLLPGNFFSLSLTIITSSTLSQTILSTQIPFTCSNNLLLQQAILPLHHPPALLARSSLRLRCRSCKNLSTPSCCLITLSLFTSTAFQNHDMRTVIFDYFSFLRQISRKKLDHTFYFLHSASFRASKSRSTRPSLFAY
jgi:hypothetical protein